MSNAESDHKSGTGTADHSHVIERAGEHVQLGLLLQLSVFAAVGTLLMLLAPEAPWSIKLLLIALVFLTLKRWGGILVLVLVQGDLFLREGRELLVLNGSGGVVFVFVVIAVLMFVARQRLLLQQIARDTIFSLARNLLSSDMTDASQENRRDTGGVILRIFASAIRGLILLFCCTAVARSLLGMLPSNRDLTSNLRDLANIDPQMSMAGVLIISLVAAWVVVSEISWRQMTAAQSRVYLRSAFVKIHYRDLRMIVLRRLRIRRKRIAAIKSQKQQG